MRWTGGERERNVRSERRREGKRRDLCRLKGDKMKVWRILSLLLKEFLVNKVTN